jgi:hypothetical protein
MRGWYNRSIWACKTKGIEPNPLLQFWRTSDCSYCIKRKSNIVVYINELQIFEQNGRFIKGTLIIQIIQLECKFFSLVLEPQFWPWPTSMKLSVSLQWNTDYLDIISFYSSLVIKWQQFIKPCVLLSWSDTLCSLSLLLRHYNVRYVTIRVQGSTNPLVCDE